MKKTAQSGLFSLAINPFHSHFVGYKRNYTEKNGRVGKTYQILSTLAITTLIGLQPLKNVDYPLFTNLISVVESANHEPIGITRFLNL